MGESSCGDWRFNLVHPIHPNVSISQVFNPGPIVDNVISSWLVCQILFDGSDVAGEPTELFYVVAPLLGKAAYSTPLARAHSINAGLAGSGPVWSSFDSIQFFRLIHWFSGIWILTTLDFPFIVPDYHDVKHQWTILNINFTVEQLWAAPQKKSIHKTMGTC